MNEDHARAFAAEWIAAWNSHDLERVLSHYRDDIVVTSPFVSRILGEGQNSVHGKTALRDFWGQALVKFPELEFNFYRVRWGVDSLVLHYRSVNDLDAMEFMRLDDAGHVREVVAHYAPSEPATSDAISPKISARSETYRGVVYPWEMDHVGHLNVQFYVKRFDEATWHFLASIGLTPAYLRAHNRDMVAREQHIEHHAEVVAGSLLVIRTGLLEVRDRSMQFEHRMFDVEGNRLVATSRLIGVQIDSTTRAATALSDAVKSKCNELLRENSADSPI